jgi:prepilin-type N-terminal cleavage/methylation domain-containing protein
MIDRYRRRGLSLLEVLIALGISSMAMGVITYMLLFSAKVARANMSQLHAGQASRTFYEHVAERTRRAKRIQVASDGLSVTFTLEPVVSAGPDIICTYTFENDDDDLDTILDNRVDFESSDSNDPDKTIISGVTPGADGWLFSPDTPRPILIMSFRVGDASEDPDDPSNVFTGPGAQGVNVTSRITPRNLHLWGG